MLPPLQTLELKANDDEVFEVDVQEDDGDPIDTTGWHVEVAINKNRKGGLGPWFYVDTDVDPRLSFDRSGPVHIVVWEVRAADTLEWTGGGKAVVQQVEMTFIDSVGKRKTPFDGVLEFRGEVLTGVSS